MNYTQRERLVDKLCGIALMLILFEVAYQVIISAFTEFNYNLSNVTTWVYVASGIVLAIAVGILVYAYLKKDGSKAVYGLETLVLAITSVTMPGTYLTYTKPFNMLNKVYPILFLVYYIGKAIYVIIDANKSNTKVSKKKAKKKR